MLSSGMNVSPESWLCNIPALVVSSSPLVVGDLLVVAPIAGTACGGKAFASVIVETIRFRGSEDLVGHLAHGSEAVVPDPNRPNSRDRGEVIGNCFVQ